MKIRLIGSSDIVRAWGQELERTYGIKGKEYPSRYSEAEVRLYVDLDDRQAALIVGLGNSTPANSSAVNDVNPHLALPGVSRPTRKR